jgi:polyisoprenoid-binding protein YceI
MRRVLLRSPAALGLAALMLGLPGRAAEQTLVLDPAATSVEWTLGATLHTVSGGVRVVEGAIRFDADSGAASGEIVLDATSASTGLALRDRNMHREVLESGRHPRIVYRAERLRVLRRGAADAEVELEGVLEMHGERHPLALPARLATRDGRIAIETGFRVPYVDWGMQDPSTLFLSVDRFVDVRVRSEGRIASP